MGRCAREASKCGRRGQGQQYQQRFSRLIGDWRLWRGAITDKLGGRAGFGVKVRFKSSLHMDWSNRKRHAQGRYVPLFLSFVLFAWPLVGCSASCVYRMLRCAVCCCCCYSVLCVVRCCVALRYVALPCPALPCLLPGWQRCTLRCNFVIIEPDGVSTQAIAVCVCEGRKRRCWGCKWELLEIKRKRNLKVCVCVWTREASRFAAKGKPSWC